MISLLCRKSTTSGSLGFESMWSDSRGKITHQLGMKCALSPCMGLFPFFRFEHPPNISTTSKYVLTSHFKLVEFDDISTTSKYLEKGNYSHTKIPKGPKEIELHFLQRHLVTANDQLFWQDISLGKCLVCQTLCSSNPFFCIGLHTYCSNLQRV